jgi:hypothetical protein
MFYLFIFSLLCIAATSCKQEKQAEEEDKPERGVNPYRYVWGQAQREPHFIEGQEKELGLEACQLLRQKREDLENQGEFSWNVEFAYREKICGQNPSATKLIKTKLSPNGDSFRFKEQQIVGSFHRKMLTDQHKLLSRICRQFFDNDGPLNTVMSEGKRYQVDFFIERDLVYIQMVRFRQQGRSFYPDRIEIAGVKNYRQNIPRDQEGFIAIRTTNLPCSDGSTRFYSQRLP